MRCLASRMKGELHPSKGLRGGRTLHVDDNFHDLYVSSGLATSRDGNGGNVQLTASWAPHHEHYVVRSFHLYRVKVLHHAHTI